MMVSCSSGITVGLKLRLNLIMSITKVTVIDHQAKLGFLAVTKLSQIGSNGFENGYMIEYFFLSG